MASSRPTFFMLILSFRKNQSVMFTLAVPAYSNVSFLLSAIINFWIDILLKKLRSIWPMETVVFKFRDSVRVTFFTSQFCTGLMCNSPQVESTSKNIERKNQSFGPLSRKDKIHAAVRPANNKRKYQSGVLGKIYTNKTMNTNQKVNVRSVHFNMYRNFCSCIFYL